MILIEAEEIEAIIAPTWESLVGIPVTRVDAPRTAGLTWRATIAFAGPVTGDVRLEVPAPLAAAFAREMFAIDDVTDDEISDAIGELANVVGGNMKAAIASGVTMGLPAVQAPLDAEESPTTVPGHVAFACNEQVFLVCVRLSEGGASA